LKGFEPFAISACVALFPHCDHFVDVGANSGVYTLAGLATNSKLVVTACEPTPRFLNAFDENIDTNRWGERVRRCSAAVADIEGYAEFLLPKGDSPYSARLASAEYRIPASSDQIARMVPVVTLDHLIADTAVDLIKIDVEGAEHLVLMGASKVLATSIPSIMFECHPEANINAVEGILRNVGYEFFQLDGPRPRWVQQIRPGSNRHLNNFLAVARQDHRSLVASIGELRQVLHD
jgi:FkbM family methyltransferase